MEQTDKKGNMYCGVLAESEEAARAELVRVGHFCDEDVIRMVHYEPPEDPEEEVGVWVFEVWADGGVEELSLGGEMLDVYFDLPELDNKPYELVNG